MSIIIFLFFILSLCSCAQKEKVHENSFKESKVSGSAIASDNEIGLYKTEVQITVRAEKDKIFKCFTETMPNLPDKSGEIVFHLVIQKAKPVKVTVPRKEDWMPESLTACLQRVIQTMKFLPEANFEKFEMDYPMYIGKTGNQKR